MSPSKACCTECGTPAGDGKFCDSCGNALAKPTSRTTRAAADNGKRSRSVTAIADAPPAETSDLTIVLPQAEQIPLPTAPGPIPVQRAPEPPSYYSESSSPTPGRRNW